MWQAGTHMEQVCRSVTSHLIPLAHGQMECQRAIWHELHGKIYRRRPLNVGITLNRKLLQNCVETLLPDPMENITGHCGLPVDGFIGANVVQRSTNLWRPWDAKANKIIKSAAQKPYTKSMAGFSDPKDCKGLNIRHPVKLFWPKSRCFDYLFQDAEILLRNYPVQATICIYEDSSSDDENDGSEDEEEGSLKEMD
ncbi:hypothetical protein UPYG_G00276250 [Umbra pygmaea]|uniref:Protein ripply2 n=1 Tax=Umbra pygmaea TaxID=75934 RepID=A0ABD0WN16_UMBPY